MRETNTKMYKNNANFKSEINKNLKKFKKKHENLKSNEEETNSEDN